MTDQTSTITRPAADIQRSSHRNKALVFTLPDHAESDAQRRFLALLGADELQDVEYTDIEQHPELAHRYGVLRAPTTVFFGTDGSVRSIRHYLVDTASFRRHLAGGSRV